MLSWCENSVFVSDESTSPDHREKKNANPKSVIVGLFRVINVIFF